MSGDRVLFYNHSKAWMESVVSSVNSHGNLIKVQSSLPVGDKPFLLDLSRSVGRLLYMKNGCLKSKGYVIATMLHCLGIICWFALPCSSKRVLHLDASEHVREYSLFTIELRSRSTWLFNRSALKW